MSVVVRDIARDDVPLPHLYPKRVFLVRWTILLSCAAPRPSAICRPIQRTCVLESVLSAVTREGFPPPAVRKPGRARRPAFRCRTRIEHWGGEAKSGDGPAGSQQSNGRGKVRGRRAKMPRLPDSRCTVYRIAASHAGKYAAIISAHWLIGVVLRFHRTASLHLAPDLVPTVGQNVLALLKIAAAPDRVVG